MTYGSDLQTFFITELMNNGHKPSDCVFANIPILFYPILFYCNHYKKFQNCK